MKIRSTKIAPLALTAALAFGVVACEADDATVDEGVEDVEDGAEDTEQELEEDAEEGADELEQETDEEATDEG